MTRRRTPIDSLVVEDLHFTVRWSARRRTIGLTVNRDGGLVVAAPQRISARRLEDAVRVKLPWVRRKLAEFVALGPPPEPRRFAAGELYPYLGHDYVLAFTDLPAEPAGLEGDALLVDRALDGGARAAVVAWYEARAREYVDEAVARYVPLVGAAPTSVLVRDLGKRRWGVCNHRSLTVSFHWLLVTQPPELVDYVVVHELVHLHEPNHGPTFWRRVHDVLPDASQRRKRLAARGDDLVF